MKVNSIVIIVLLSLLVVFSFGSFVYLKKGQDEKKSVSTTGTDKTNIKYDQDVPLKLEDKKNNVVSSSKASTSKGNTKNSISSVSEVVGESDGNILNSMSKLLAVDEHIVAPGDNLFNIAKRYNTTVELIRAMNSMSGDTIRVGQPLKVNKSKFSIYVDKAQNIMILKKDGEMLKQYTIATGRDNSTPVGTFFITDRMVKPIWTKPNGDVVMPDDEDYELGERWMPISIPGYGIHGTNDEKTIGAQTTSGCVRMYNRDVIELYNLVPKGTKVEIVDTKAIVGANGKKAEVSETSSEDTQSK